MKRRLSSSENDYAIGFFVEVWAVLGCLFVRKEHFALQWLMKDELLLKRFCEEVLGVTFGNFSRSLLYNGFMSAKTLDFPLFSPKEWSHIDWIFIDHKSFRHIPHPIRQVIVKLRGNVFGLIAERKQVLASSSQFLAVDVQVTRVEPTLLGTCVNSFLGAWDARVLDKFHEDVHHIFKAVPIEFIKIEGHQNYTYVYDCSSGERVLVAMKMAPQVLSTKAQALIRSYLDELFSGHPVLTRGASKESFQSTMSGFGPFFNQYKKEVDKVSFYTHKNKLKSVFKEVQTIADFQALVDSFSHLDLMEIILGLYLWWCPNLLESFFAFSDPYLSKDDFTPSKLEKELGFHGPAAYQLYITKDYCSEFHRDKDVTDFSLCYCSHPDEAESPVDFILAECGVCLQVGNAQMFAFRSSYLHGTGFRVPTANAALVGCVVVNQSLNNLLARRRCSRA